MKKLFTMVPVVLLMLCFCSNDAVAQKTRGGSSVSSSSSTSLDYRRIEWDLIRFGYVVPFGDGVAGGISVSTEPRFNINNKMSASVRWEIALFASDVEDDSASLGASGSYALFGDYYFKEDSANRPFAGLGIGTFAGGNLEVEDGNGNVTSVEGGNAIGIIPRIGYETRFFRLAAEYNLPFKDTVSSYLGVSLGITINGKYKG